METADGSVAAELRLSLFFFSIGRRMWLKSFKISSHWPIERKEMLNLDRKLTFLELEYIGASDGEELENVYGFLIFSYMRR